jgi:hypothetical protein
MCSCQLVALRRFQDNPNQWCAFFKIRGPFTHSGLGGFVPANPLSLASHISDKLAVHSPGLTFDVITEFARGFHKSSASHKAACIYYLSPWIKNLSTFPDLTSTHGHNSGGKLRETFRILIELLVKDFEVRVILFDITRKAQVQSPFQACSSVSQDYLGRNCQFGARGDLHMSRRACQSGH